MWSPDPWCRKCARHPAGSGVLWSDQLVFLRARFCGEHQNLPASGEAPSTNGACGWTSDCRTTREQELDGLWHTLPTVCAVWFTTSGDGLQMFARQAVPVSGAVHGFECKDIFFHREGEHVFAVVLPVARCLPQFAVIDVRGGYFLKASSPVLFLKKTKKTPPRKHINKLIKSATWPSPPLPLAVIR